MKIRDGFATITNNKTEYALKSGALDIIGDDGLTLFEVLLYPDGSIRVASGDSNWKKQILDGKLHIEPIASNAVRIFRPIYAK